MANPLNSLLVIKILELDSIITNKIINIKFEQ